MAGLLDFSPDQWQALTLLGSGVAAGNAPGGFQAASSLLASAPKRAMEMQMAQAQLAEMQAQGQDRALKFQREQEAMELARRKQAALPGLFGGGMQPAQPGQIGSGSFGAMPAPAGGDMPQRQPGGGQFNVQAAIRAGFSPKEIMEYAALRNANQDEVARTIEGRDAQNRPITTQFDKFGRPVGAPVEQWKAPVFQNLGGRTAAIDPVSLGERGSFAQTMSPEGRDASARGWAGVNLQRQNAEQGKWQYDAQRGGLVNMQSGEFKPAMQGGQPIETKASREAAKEALQRRSAISGADSVLKEVRDAKGLVGWNTAGVGGVLANVPATDARDLSAKLQTIKANLGFDRLQQMRSESPTGGALGQVAVQELAALQATVASLDQLQGSAQLGQALDKIDTHYTNWKNVMQQSQGPQGGATGVWGIREKK
jgi:hypothetical protein